MISIVTGTLNRKSFLPGLIANTVDACPRLELILVDGGSTDGTLDFLRELRHPRVKLIEVGQRSSYAHFMNLGIRASMYEHVCQWNDDVLLANSWDEVIAELDNKFDFYLFNWKDGNAQSIRDPKWLKGEGKECGWQLESEKPNGSIVVNYGIYSKKVFRAIGLYSMDYYHYQADGDMSERAWAFGFKAKELWHIKVVSLTTWKEKRAVDRGEGHIPEMMEPYRRNRELYRKKALSSSLEFLTDDRSRQ